MAQQALTPTMMTFRLERLQKKTEGRTAIDRRIMDSLESYGAEYLGIDIERSGFMYRYPVISWCDIYKFIDGMPNTFQSRLCLDDSEFFKLPVSWSVISTESPLFRRPKNAKGTTRYLKQEFNVFGELDIEVTINFTRRRLNHAAWKWHPVSASMDYPGAYNIPTRIALATRHDARPFLPQNCKGTLQSFLDNIEELKLLMVKFAVHPDRDTMMETFMKGL